MGNILSDDLEIKLLLEGNAVKEIPDKIREPKNEAKAMTEINITIDEIKRKTLHEDCDNLMRVFPLQDYEPIIGPTINSAYNRIFKALHKDTGFIIMVKALTKRYSRECKLNYPSDEVLILKKLDHEGILKCFEVIIMDEITYMITEIIPGMEFFEYLAQNDCFKEEQAKIYAKHIAKTIYYLHKLNICHRDIKLENFVLDKNGMPKLIDFGFACQFSEGKTLSKICGSVDYASPELWLHENYQGPEVDIWAFGVMLYIMITGFLPFNDTKSIVSIKYGYPPNIKISKEFKELLSCIFVPSWGRYNIERLMKDPWMNCEIPCILPKYKSEFSSKEEISKSIIEHHKN